MIVEIEQLLKERSPRLSLCMMGDYGSTRELLFADGMWHIITENSCASEYVGPSFEESLKVLLG